MRPIRTVLVTTDFSDTSQSAFALARQMAERFDAKLVLFHALDLQVPPLVIEHVGAAMEGIEREHREQAEQTLKRLAAELGPGTDTELATGVAHAEICRAAEERAVDLIVMATHGRGFLSHALLGSTTERVIRRAPCPVLVERTGSDDRKD